MKHITVIGGGIIGLSTAYYLAKEGYKVTVIDKSNMSNGASFINAGYISPSHIISLASPEMLKKGVQYMFKKDAPFYIKPRWDTSFFQWAYHFYRSSTHEKVKKAIPVIKEITLLSKDCYDQIKQSNDIGSFQWEKKGLLLLYKTQKEADSEFYISEIVKKEGLEVNHLSKKELVHLEPCVHNSEQGAFWYKCDAHSTPNEFMKKMYEYLKKQNVNFIINEEVTDAAVERGAIKRIITNKDEYQTDEVVLAAGSWTGSLGARLQIKMPLQPGKGYSINVTRDIDIRYPAVLMESKVAITPMKGFTRFAGTMEFSGNNHIVRKERVRAIAKAASIYYKDMVFNETELLEARCGLRPVTPDGLPYIGRPAKFKNLIVAAGHAMMGWSMGPATGKLVSEMISEKKMSMNIDPFNPDRFS
jgi:D-amino-acid dehydrogenase